MSINRKKILLILGFIVAVVAIAYLLYFVFLRPSVPGTPNANTNTTPGVLPGSQVNANTPVGGNAGVLPGSQVNANIPGADQGNIPPTVSPIASGGLTEIKSMNSTKSYGTTLSSDGSSIIFYDKITGQFFRLTPDGKSSLLTNNVFNQVDSIVWAPNKEKAILEYPDGANILYNFKTNTQITLPKHWKNFDFSPNSNKIVFKSLGANDDNKWLVAANEDGSNAQKIELIGSEGANVYPQWSPNNQIVTMYTRDSGLENQDLYFVGLNNENFKSISLQGRGFQGTWSTQGNRLLYSAYSESSNLKPNLWIVSAQGEDIGRNQKNLGLQTWAEKCTFSNNDTVYCAVPQSLDEGAGIFYKDLDNSPCDIYKIDLATGVKSKIAIPATNHNIKSLTVSDNGKYLYFVSQDNGQIYQIKLN